MPVQSRPVGTPNVEVPEALTGYYGQYAIQESGPQVSPWQGAEELCLTGGTNAYVADVTYAQTADVTLLASASAGVPANLRFHLTNVSWNLHGAVSWAGGSYVYLKDNAGATLGQIPLIALTAFRNLSWPVSGCDAFYNVKALATPFYVAATGVLTLAAAALTTTTLAGAVLTVVGGLGKGQSGIIASNTATTITMDQPFALALDSTSVIGISRYAATAADATTMTDTKAVWTSGQFTGGNWYIVQVSGTYAGQITPIVSNTGTVLTVAALLRWVTSSR